MPFPTDSFRRLKTVRQFAAAFDSADQIDALQYAYGTRGMTLTVKRFSDSYRAQITGLKPRCE